MKTEKHIEELRDGWKRQTFINHQNGAITKSYLYKGKHRGITLRLETHKANHLRGYSLIHKDFRDAKIWLNEAQKNHAGETRRAYLGNKTPQKQIINKGLLKASIMNYQKAFDSPKGRQVRLHRNDIPKELHKEHDYLIEARHQYAAHGGISDFESCRAVLACPPKNKLKIGDPIIPYFETDLYQAAWIDPKDFLALLDFNLEFLDKKIESLTKKIVEEVFAINPAVFYRFFSKTSKSVLNQKDLEEMQKITRSQKK